jgi:hypothetical protein
MVVHVGVDLTTAHEKRLTINGHGECSVLLVLVTLCAAEGPAKPDVLTVLVLVGGGVIAKAVLLTVELVNVLVDKWHLSDHQ